ncbi:MAG: hypothetical protein RRY78_01020, partial [Clostridia bacterium]
MYEKLRMKNFVRKNCKENLLKKNLRKKIRKEKLHRKICARKKVAKLLPLMYIFYLAYDVCFVQNNRKNAFINLGGL